MTTMEEINATGVLMAISDGLTYVSVLPINITKIFEWISTRPITNEHPHKYTLLLQGILIRMKG